MKKLLSILITGLVVFSCSQNIEFDDYDYQSIYFPYQSPVRTIVLGDEVLGDNTIDREHAFSIGVTMSGAYTNEKDRTVSLEYAPELAENLTDDQGNAIELMPASYYNAEFGEVTIPAGEFTGRMRVELTDAFFQDPLTTTTHYVIPVRIASTDGDTILRGEPNSFVENPDPRVSEDWNVIPKDYTLFGVKYINETHGMYLLRGSRTNAATNEETSYSERFLTENGMVMLTTESLNQNVMHTLAGAFTANELFTMLLTVDKTNQTISISKTDVGVNVSGTGVYYSKDDPEAESYNEQKHRTMYLDYSFTRGATYNVKDSLVFVDTDVTFEQFIPVVTEPAP